MNENTIRLTARCDTLRQNNGIIEALFVDRTISEGQDQQVLVNLHLPAGSFEHGALYAITFAKLWNKRP